MRKLNLFFFWVLCFSFSTAQNISGVINAYAAVTIISGKNITVKNTAGFLNGDKILLIQMKGVSINTSANSSAYGDITTYGNAGNYEFLDIATINGNMITLKVEPCKSYDISSQVQLIKVPVYSAATVSSLLSCSAWNGETGGVLVFESTGSVTLNADIDVSGKGFLGGGTGVGFNCGSNDYAAPYGAGKKGEGIAVYTAGLEYGGGHLANGGGGSFGGNSGGGGGGNYGAGGIGGKEFDACGTQTQSIGGANLSYGLSNKIFLGGGGGGGQADNGNQIYPGGNGGGIVIIKAASVNGNAHAIISNGNNVTANIQDEGGSGGGAGGSIYLFCSSFSGALVITANGGNGNSNFNQQFPSNCHGPGAGGGGGVAGFSNTALPAGVLFTANGGLAGKVLNPASSCYNTSHGAANGQNGGTVFNLSLPIFPALNLGIDKTICEGNNVKLIAPAGFTSYLWNTGATIDSITVTDVGNYWLTVTNLSGCKITDTVGVARTPSPIISLGEDKTICQGDNVKLIAPAGFASYLWNTGATADNITATTAGKYFVTVTTATGCKGRDTVDVFISPLKKIDLGADKTICTGDTIVLDAGAPYNSYTWQDGTSSQFYKVFTAGTYTVDATQNAGCKGTGTVTIALHPQSFVNLGANKQICPGEELLLDAGGGFKTYLWNNGSAAQQLSANAVGLYSVTTEDNNGCFASDTIMLTLYPDCNEKTTYFIPNSFTPNNDGLNDGFKATLKYFREVKLFTLTVYNRWGQIVFTTNDFNKAWDGRFGTTQCDAGAYVWTVSINGTTNRNKPLVEFAKGTLTLLR